MQAGWARVIGEGTGCEICNVMCEGADCKISSGRATARAHSDLSLPEVAVEQGSGSELGDD